MAQPATHHSAQEADRPATLPRFRALTAADLPPLMTVTDDPRGAYRFPVLQFISDWNTSQDRSAMIRFPPVYEGDDALLLPTIAAVVHALAVRDGVLVPDWVLTHRAPHDTAPFWDTSDGWYRRRLLTRAPDTCAYHGIWFHPRLLDKGTPDWWLPWD